MGDSLQGVGVSPGIVLGPAHLLHAVDAQTRPARDVRTERQDVDRIAMVGMEQLRSIAKKLRDAGQTSAADIMDAQALMAQDPALLEAVYARIDAGDSAATALQAAGNTFKGMLEALGDEYMAARAADVQDVVTRAIRNLSDSAETPGLQEPSIVVARDLSPSDTVSLDRSLVLGIAIDMGSPTSHTAILAQALGIPAVVALGDISSRMRDVQPLLLDGERGVVIVDPSPEETKEFQMRSRDILKRQTRLAAIRDEPAETRDGRRLTLAANIGSADDLPSAAHVGAEGIGLFRTEFLFAGRDRMPTEDEQIVSYRSALEAMAPHLVVVRTLDIGGDKPLPYLPAALEANPFLGERGIRYTLAHPEVFRSQLRALLRASKHGKLGIMFPMIGDATQLQQANAVLDDVRAEVGGDADVGIMIEVPSAALTANSLARDVSFFSVGTNDLVQYALAVDRVNDRIAHLYQPLHPAVIRLLAMTVDAAHAHSLWAGVCGEMAGDPATVPILIGLGFDELSMTPNRLPMVKERVRSLDYEACRVLARQAPECDTAEQVVELLGSAAEIGETPR